MVRDDAPQSDPLQRRENPKLQRWGKESGETWLSFWVHLSWAGHFSILFSVYARKLIFCFSSTYPLHCFQLCLPWPHGCEALRLILMLVLLESFPFSSSYPYFTHPLRPKAPSFPFYAALMIALSIQKNIEPKIRVPLLCYSHSTVSLRVINTFFLYVSLHIYRMPIMWHICASNQML